MSHQPDKTAEYNPAIFNKDIDNQLLSKIKSKSTELRLRKFFERKNFNSLELFLWVKTYIQDCKTVTEDTYSSTLYHNHLSFEPKILDNLKFRPLTVIFSGIIFTLNITTSDRIKLCQFVHKEIELDKIIKLYNFLAYYRYDFTYAVVMKCPYMSFKERLGYSLDFIQKDSYIIHRMFLETNVNLEEAYWFLDHYEEIVASTIQYSHQHQFKYNFKDIDFYDFVRFNTSLNPFEKIFLFTEFIDKIDSPGNKKENSLELLVRHLFRSTQMTLKEITRTEYWLPLLGIRYEGILMSAANRRGNSVSKNRAKVFEFRQTLHAQNSNSINNTDTQEMIKNFYTGRINYLDK